MDMYSSLASPTIGFLGTPTLSRLSGSFISSSFRSTKHTPEIITSLIKPLLPTTVADQEQHDEIERRQSSHTLLLPSRKPSLEKIQEKVSHEFSIAKNCSYGQAVLNGQCVLNLNFILI